MYRRDRAVADFELPDFTPDFGEHEILRIDIRAPIAFRNAADELRELESYRAFRDRSARDEYFAQLTLGERVPERGEALRQALSCVGIWVDNDMLRSDCARIMAAELEAFRDAEGRKAHGIAAAAVEQSPAFRKAFNAVRAYTQSVVSNLVRATGENNQHLKMARLGVITLRMESLYHEILDEIGLQASE